MPESAVRTPRPESDPWLAELEASSRSFVDHGSNLRHNLLNLGCLAVLIACFPVTWSVARALPVWIGLPLAGFVYGTVVFSLFTLVVHEASHNRFLIVRSPRARRRLNDAFGWSICLPFMRDYSAHWREGHLLHHRRTLEEDDPQNCAKYVLEKRDLARKLLKVWLVPFYEFELYRLWLPELDDRCPKIRHRGGRLRKPLRILGLIAVWAALAGSPLLVAPVFTLLVVCWGIKWAASLNFLKSSLEHGGGYLPVPDLRLKTRGLVFPGKNLFFPFCVTPYHWEHHLNPAIPWYRLPAFRRTAEPRVPAGSRELVYTPMPALLERVLLP